MLERAAAVAKETGAARPWLRIVALIVLLAVLLMFGRESAAYVPRFAEWVGALGLWGPLVFIAGYAIATVAFVPGSLLTLAAGAIFGVTRGVAIVFVGASVGAIAAFVLARTVARGAIEKKLEGNARFEAIDRAVGDEGLKIVTLLRLSPVFPFNLLNYALGLTGVRLRDYALACFGMLPGTLLYVYSGKVAGDLAALVGGVGTERGPGYYAVITIGLLATAIVTVLVTRTARRALRSVTHE